MEIKIDTGIKGIENKNVIFEDTAASYESGIVEVFATPAMIKLMEKTCLKSVDPYLPKGFSTVGTKVDIVHSKASLLNAYITCQSELIEVDRKRLVFKVTAFDEKGEIGKGLHERFIIDVKKFMTDVR